MNGLLQTALSNAMMVVPLALLAAAVSLGKPRPAVMHVLLIIVLTKLVTPT
jgi:lipopolysaccharide export LptBFGC system permease protein LptF